jgi:hypothetical protein
MARDVTERSYCRAAAADSVAAVINAAGPVRLRRRLPA